MHLYRYATGIDGSINPVSYSPCLRLRYFMDIIILLFLREEHCEDSDMKSHCWRTLHRMDAEIHQISIGKMPVSCLNNRMKHYSLSKTRLTSSETLSGSYK